MRPLIKLATRSSFQDSGAKVIPKMVIPTTCRPVVWRSLHMLEHPSQSTLLLCSSYRHPQSRPRFTNASLHLFSRFRLDTSGIRPDHLRRRHLRNLQRYTSDEIYRLSDQADLLDHWRIDPDVFRQHGELSGVARERALVLHCIHSVVVGSRRGWEPRARRKALDQAARRSALPAIGMDQAGLDIGASQVLLRLGWTRRRSARHCEGVPDRRCTDGIGVEAARLGNFADYIPVLICALFLGGIKFKHAISILLLG